MNRQRQEPGPPGRGGGSHGEPGGLLRPKEPERLTSELNRGFPEERRGVAVLVLESLQPSQEQRCGWDERRGPRRRTPSPASSSNEW